MLVVLACGTGCPGDDIPPIPTGNESSGSGTTGLPTTGSPTTITITDSDGDTEAGTGGSGGSGDTGETDGLDSSGTDTGPECGNGVLEGDEECDGDDFGRMTCADIAGFEGGELACNDDCTLDTDGCEVSSDCGNDALDDGEVCDGDQLDGEDCTTQLYVVGQNYDGGELACNRACSGFDVSGCYVCGNDTVDGPEVCDGPDLGGEDCMSLGFAGGTLGCTDDCGVFDTSGCFQEACNMPGTPIGPNAFTVTTDTVMLPMAPGEFLTDVDIVLDANHTYVSDLFIDVQHVDTATSLRIAENPCDSEDDIDATFDQQAAAAPDCVEPVAIEGDVIPPDDSLDGFVGIADPGGLWELEITDNFNADGGTLNNWCVRYTTSPVDPVTCGDMVINFGEECEGMDLNGQDCDSIGFAGGTLSCDGSCQFDTSMCNPAVLLLGDDTSDPLEWDVYRNILAARGIGWDEWNLATDPWPVLMDLDPYRTIIWFDEGAISTVDADTQAVADWLTSDFDHNLFATGIDFMWDFENAAPGTGENTMYLLFEAAYDGDASGAMITTIDGVMGDPIGGDFVAPGGLALSGTQSSGDWTDQTMGALATSAAVYGPGGPGTGGTALTHYNGGTYQIVWLGVSFHAGLADSGQQEQLMNNILDYFDN